MACRNGDILTIPDIRIDDHFPSLRKNKTLTQMFAFEVGHIKQQLNYLV